MLHYDFSKTRVRKDGKSMTKFDLAWDCERIGTYFPYVPFMDAYSYDELKQVLIKKLNEYEK